MARISADLSRIVGTTEHFLGVRHLSPLYTLVTFNPHNLRVKVSMTSPILFTRNLERLKHLLKVLKPNQSDLSAQAIGPHLGLLLQSLALNRGPRGRMGQTCKLRDSKENQSASF